MADRGDTGAWMGVGKVAPAASENASMRIGPHKPHQWSERYFQLHLCHLESKTRALPGRITDGRRGGVATAFPGTRSLAICPH